MAEQPLPFSAYGACMYFYGVANAARHRPGPCMPLAPLLFQPHARCQVPKESQSGCHASSWTEEPCEWLRIRYVAPVRSRAIGQQGGQPCPFFLFISFYWILKTRSVWSYIDRGSRGPGLRAAWTERALGHGGCARCCRPGGLMDGVGLGGGGAGGFLAVTGLGHFLLCET